MKMPVGVVWGHTRQLDHSLPFIRWSRLHWRVVSTCIYSYYPITLLLGLGWILAGLFVAFFLFFPIHIRALLVTVLDTMNSFLVHHPVHHPT